MRNDLIDILTIRWKIAEKLDEANLRIRFMEVYYAIVKHPESREKCKLVVGKAKGMFRPKGPGLYRCIKIIFIQ